ncbi:MAG: methyltransferase, TIGR04325 family [Oligoflexales bacterium]
MKKIIKDLCPPAILKIKRNIANYLDSNRIIFSGPVDSFFKGENPWLSEGWINHSKERLNLADRFNPGVSIQSLSLLINSILAEREQVSVLDFGGGTGLMYHVLERITKSSEKMEWIVFDDNEPLMKLGKEYSANNKNIKFIKSINEINKVDIVYINTSVQYFDDYKVVFDSILKLSPKHVVLSRLLCAKNESIITRQKIYGKISPCKFVNKKELVFYFKDHGFKNSYESKSHEDFTYMMTKEVAKKVDNRPGWNLVFTKQDALAYH